MIQKNYETVSEAVNDLVKQGYTFDFSISHDKDCIICLGTTVELADEDFEIDGVYRFEGNSDPGDSMIVYAISSKDESIKGVVVNGYGVYANTGTSKIVAKLNRH